MEEKIIAYGVKRKEREFSHVPYMDGQIYIDTDQSLEAEREILLDLVEDKAPHYKIVIAVLETKDFGRGIGYKSFVKAVESRGGTVKLYPPKASAKAKKETGNPILTDEQTDKVCVVWANNGLSEASRIARINNLEGVPKLDKSQIYYVCVTKPKRQAASTAKRVNKEN